MGTRGFVGVVVDDTVKLTYNHWDSYPDGLGAKTLTDLRNRLAESDVMPACCAQSGVGVCDSGPHDFKQKLNTLRQKARDLKMIDESAEPTAEEIALFQKYSDPTVGGSIEKPTDGRTISSYYQLIRKLQGELFQLLDLGIATDADGFQFDSLFCEWGYLVDFDNNVFQVYEGFQRKRHDKGRWAGMPTDQDIKDKADRAQKMFEAGEINEQQLPYWSETVYHAVALVAEWPLDALPSDEDFAAKFVDEDDD